MINSGDLLENMVDLVNEFYEESMQAAMGNERGDIKTENVEDDDDNDNEGNDDDEEDEEEEDSEDDDSEDDSDEEEDSSDEGDDLLLQEQKKSKQQAMSGSFSFTGSTSFPINSNNSSSSTARVSFNSNNNANEQRQSQQQQQNIFVGSVGSSMSLLNRRQANQTPINSRKHARTDNNSGIKIFLSSLLIDFFVFDQFQILLYLTE
jgi:hypothetical protein